MQKSSINIEIKGRKILEIKKVKKPYKPNRPASTDKPAKPFKPYKPNKPAKPVPRTCATCEYNEPDRCIIHGEGYKARETNTCNDWGISLRTFIQQDKKKKK